MFKILTKDEFDALTPAQQNYYMEQKKAHDDKEVDDRVKASVKAAIDAQREELKADNQAIIDALKAENKTAIDELTESQKTKLDEVVAAMKRAKVGESKLRLKGFSDHIIDTLSTEKGEQMIKDFLAGQRSKLNVTIGGDDDPDFTVKAMGVPTNGVAPEFTPIVGPGHDEFHARTIIPVFPTISNLIRYIQYTVDTTTGLGFATVGVGAQKPSLNYIPTVKDAPVQKIAGLLDVPDELLDDVVGFRAWIAYELPKAYMDAEDLQIFKGDGTGLNLQGLWTQAGNQTFPQGSVTAASNTIDKIVAGITQVRKLKRNTSAVVISAVAWQEILINKGTTKDYTYPIVLDANGVMRIGGVPIFWSNVFADGEGLVGDFARGTAIFQRKAMVIGYFDQNKDNVEKNIVTIRLEGRIALPIFYPESFKKLLLVVTT